MNQNQDGKVRALAAQLDELVPREGAKVRLRGDYNGDMTVVRGNRRGYLRLGIEFLNAAFASHTRERPDEIRVDVYYLLGQDEICYLFERSEKDSEERAAGSVGLKGALASLAAIAFPAFFIASCTVGAPKVAGWLADTLWHVIETVIR